MVTKKKVKIVRHKVRVHRKKQSSTLSIILGSIGLIANVFYPGLGSIIAARFVEGFFQLFMFSLAIWSYFAVVNLSIFSASGKAVLVPLSGFLFQCLLSFLY